MELERNGPEERPSALFGNHKTIHLFQKRVPSLQTGSACLEERLSESIGLLAATSVVIVVPRKRVEGAQLHPSRTKLFGRILVKAADVCPHHLYSEYLEEKVAIDGEPEEVPIGYVVSSPVACKIASSHAVASGDNERPLSFLLEELMSGNSGHMAIVGVLLPMKQRLFGGGVMGNLDIDGHLINSLILLDLERLLRRLVPLEVRRLIHVQPHSRKLDFPVETSQVLLPEGRSIRMVEIHKMHLPWPHLRSIVVSPVGLAQKYIHLSTQSHRIVVLDGHSRVDQRHEMDLVLIHDFIELSVAMGLRVHRKDHLMIHVVQVRPKDVQGQIVFPKPTHHLLQDSRRFVTPTALVVPHTPKRRNMTSPYKFVVALQKRLRVMLAYQNQKVQLASNRVEQQIVAILTCLDQKAERILKVEYMMQLCLRMPGQIERVETVSLVTEVISPPIDLPRLIAVPQSPFTISHSELLLESLTQTPFSRFVMDPKSVVQLAKGRVADAEDRISIQPPYIHQRMILDSDFSLALFEQGVGVSTQRRLGLCVPKDVEPGSLLELFFLGEADAEHVSLSAGDLEVVGLVVMGEKVGLFKVVICERINLQGRVRLHDCQAQTDKQEDSKLPTLHSKIIVKLNDSILQQRKRRSINISKDCLWS